MRCFWRLVVHHFSIVSFIPKDEGELISEVKDNGFQLVTPVQNEHLKWAVLFVGVQTNRMLLTALFVHTTVTSVTVLMNFHLFINEEQKFIGCSLKEVFISSVTKRVCGTHLSKDGSISVSLLLRWIQRIR